MPAIASPGSKPGAKAATGAGSSIRLRSALPAIDSRLTGGWKEPIFTVSTKRFGRQRR